MDVEDFLTNWAKENTEELVDNIEDIILNENLNNEQQVKLVCSKTLNFIFAALSQAIKENNTVIEKQLRRAGLHLP